MFIGLLIASLGILMLLKQLGIIGSAGAYIAPVAIILVGLEIAFGFDKRGKKQNPDM